MTGPSRSRASLLAYAALAAAVIGIAWSAIFVRWAEIPGVASAFYRVLIAACVLLPWRAVHAPSSATRQPPTRRAWIMALAAGVCFGLDLAFFNTAIMRSSAATTSLLGSNAPVFVGLGLWLLLKKQPHRLFWAGLAASMAGIVLMIWAGASGPGRDATLDAPHDLIGDLMAVAAALFFAGYLLAVAEARESMDTLTVNAIAMAASTATLLPICLVMGAPLGNYTSATWLALVWLGLVSQVGAYLGIAYALGHLPTTVVSVGLLAQAPLTAILATWLLREQLTPLQLAGGALVLAGIYIVNRPEPGDARPATTESSAPARH
ncbi:MAG: DMT family transporter [Acidobacteriota bacterium]|nr:DMT family transporter [Acidobacteriota bacterium]